MYHRVLFSVIVFAIGILIPINGYVQNLKFDTFPGQQINVLNLSGAIQIFGDCTATLEPSVDEFKETYRHPFWGAMY